MSKPEENNNVVSNNSVVWLLISLVLVVILSLILPFPISFIMSLLVIISVSIIRADRALKKAGMGGIRTWYKSNSSLQSGHGGDGNLNNSLYRPLRFSCMNCGKVHNESACPKCGSKAVTAG